MKTSIRILFFFLLITEISFAQWVQVGLNDESIKDIAVKNSNMFAITVDEGKLFRSTDNGANWTMIVDSCARDVEISLTEKVFLVVKEGLIGFFEEWKSLYYSNYNGETWVWSNIIEQISDSLPCFIGSYCPQKTVVGPTGIIFSFVAQRGPLFSTCGWEDYFALSNDDGLTWRTPVNMYRGGAFFDFRKQYAITLGVQSTSGAYVTCMSLSSDYGNEWYFINHPLVWGHSALGFFSNDNIIMSGRNFDWGSPEIHISTDMGSSWSQISSLNCQVGLALKNEAMEGILIGTDSLGVFLFSDEGDNLGSWNEGLTNLNILALTVDDNGYAYAGTENGVWRRPLSEVTPLEENQIEISSRYILSQNFPNPFNPGTKIKYSVPQISQVQIKVFDVLGNEIETLVNEEKPVGTYELTWNAVNLPCGVYFYQLNAGEFTQTKKMLLLK